MTSNTDKPVVNTLTLRRDLYFVMSLLLADEKVAKVEGVANWAQDFHENEVRRLMLWVAVALRGLLDLLPQKNSIKDKSCGEYWDVFPKGKEKVLKFRQACNSIIHAKEIWPYRVGTGEYFYRSFSVVGEKKETTSPSATAKSGTKHLNYSDRITVRSTNRGKTTRAQIDIIKFVQIADILINHSQEASNANR